MVTTTPLVKMMSATTLGAGASVEVVVAGSVVSGVAPRLVVAVESMVVDGGVPDESQAAATNTRTRMQKTLPITLPKLASPGDSSGVTSRAFAESR